MSLYFLHLTSIRCITSLSTSLYPWLKDPRYLNFSLLAMTLVSILTSTSSSWVMSLHLQSKYSILVLPNLNPLKSQVCVQPLAYCQSIQCHLQNIHPWICRSAFIIKANKNGLSIDPWCNPIMSKKCSGSSPKSHYPHPCHGSIIHVLMSLISLM